MTFPQPYKVTLSLLVLSILIAGFFFSGSGGFTQSKEESTASPKLTEFVPDLRQAVAGQQQFNTEAQETAPQLSAAITQTATAFTAEQDVEPDTLLSVQQALLEQASQEIRFHEGLSAFNLMLLKDLAIRINEGQTTSQTGTHDELLELAPDWPSEFIDTLLRLSAAYQAETDLNKHWQTQAQQNPQAYREAYLKQQKDILGDALFRQLHREDVMIIDEAGLSAHFAETAPTEELTSAAHQEKTQLLQQWQQNQISETQLRQSLAQDLSNEEIDQLVDTGTHEANWLNRIGSFLEEYRYVEQSGIIGADEQQMRQELLEKHFQPENRNIANQFLFGAQPASPR